MQYGGRGVEYPAGVIKSGLRWTGGWNGEVQKSWHWRVVWIDDLITNSGFCWNVFQIKRQITTSQCWSRITTKMIFEYTSFSLSVNFRTVWDLYSWPYLTSLSERALRVQICGRYNNRSSQLTALLRGDSLKIPALPTSRCTVVTITLPTPRCTL